MRTVISIQGKNERLGQLFKKPKHQLLYEGRPAIERTVQYMSRFGPVHVLGLEGQSAPNLTTLPFLPLIDCFKEFGIDDDTFYVDCDIVPIQLTLPKGNTIYTFKKPPKAPNQYGNVSVINGRAVECNEKGMQFNFCSTGIYFFASGFDFFSRGCASLSQVFNRMIASGETVYAEECKTFRFGTLHDITGL